VLLCSGAPRPTGVIPLILGCVCVQVWDWDRHGGDDHISQVKLTSLDIRTRCCLPDRRPVKYQLGCIPGAKKQELK